MSIYTQIAHRLSKDDYELVITEVTNWAEKQAKEYSNSQFVLKDPAKAYRQALEHLKFSLINKEEQI